MRVLIVAEHASVGFGGEAILPVHYFGKLRRRGIEAWLLVHDRTQAEVESLFPTDVERLYFVADSRFHKVLGRMKRFLPAQLAEQTLGQLQHLYTQLQQRRRIKILVEELGIDIVHEPIPVSPKSPSLTFGFGVPVVIGPMNGGMVFPPAFQHMQGLASRIFVGVGRWIANFANVMLPGKLLASTLLVANERSRDALPRWHRGKVVELTENGVDLEVWVAPPSVSGEPDSLNAPIRFVFMGRLIDLKAVDLVIEALSIVRQSHDAVLEILGDGPDRARLEHLVARHGLDEAVIFRGWLSQQQCSGHLADSHALVLPSLHECGGAVVLEAMALSRPVIATDWGGPSDYLDESCGMLIKPESKTALVNGFAASMNKLCAEPALRAAMGAAGRQKVERDYDWSHKIDQILEIYEQTLVSAAE